MSDENAADIPETAAAAESAPDEAEATEAASAEVTAAEESPATAPAPAKAAKKAAKAEPAPNGSDVVRPNRRKVREGLVLSVKMDKTAVVGVIERVRHPRYAKTVQRTKRLYAHDADNDLRVGDRVRVAETRPLSKLKRWRVVDVVERAK
jgi:small subunit ribosomal protein S17